MPSAALNHGDIVVGRSGFHGPPNGEGMVEVGYYVEADHRHCGYATMMLIDLLQRATVEPAVHIVRATIAPDNVASLATIARFGFANVGEQWDERDGLETIFERPAHAPIPGHSQ